MPNKFFNRGIALGSLVGVGLLLSSGLPALAFTPEGDLMKIKGYSPEVIQAADMQRSRQEWRTPSAPKKTPMERFFHNIYYGDWTGSIDEFGSQLIREQ